MKMPQQAGTCLSHFFWISLKSDKIVVVVLECVCSGGLTMGTV